MTQKTIPHGTTTANTYVYSQFALGEMTSTQEGSKTSTLYSYDDTDGYKDANALFIPCGLVSSIASPKPGSASGSGARVTTTFSYDVSGRGSQPMGSLGLGNLTSMTAPGNNATLVNGVDKGITTTFAYTGDGTPVTTPSLGQPLTVTDNLGNVTHMRYDAQGQTVAAIDALGNETDSSYNENGGTVSLGSQHSTVFTGYTGVGTGSGPDLHDGKDPTTVPILLSGTGGNEYSLTLGNYDEEFAAGSVQNTAVIHALPVPEASSVVSLALLLALGLGAVVVRRKARA